MRLAVALTHTPANVDDALFAALRRQFTPRQLVELSSAISWENFQARNNRTFGIESAGFSEGAFCPLPERESAGGRELRSAAHSD